MGLFGPSLAVSRVCAAVPRLIHAMAFLARVYYHSSGVRTALQVSKDIVAVPGLLLVV